VIKVPSALNQAVKDDNLVIFVGAGASMNSGLPSWNKLIENTLKDNSSEITNTDFYLQGLSLGALNPIDLLDMIKEHKKIILTSFEKQMLEEPSNTAIQEKICAISTKLVTTNFDTLLEKSLPSARVITHDSQYNLSKIDTEDEFILKVHGDISRIDKCIIFKDQYENLYDSETLSTFEIKKILSSRSVLFIGFSFDDPYVKELFDYIEKLQDGFGEKHFIASLYDVNISGLETIKLEDYSRLSELLDNIIATKNSIVEQSKDDASNNAEVDQDPIIIENDGSDKPPRIGLWVGREKELSLLSNSAINTYFITGMGGQGKSLLAANALEQLRDSGEYDYIDWRDFKEEDHKIQSKIISMINLVSRSYSDERLAGIGSDQLVDIFFNELGQQKGVFVLDNVDSYIELEEYEPTGGIAKIFHCALKSNHNSKFIFTCRPFIRYAGPNFYQIGLNGLSKDETSDLFLQSDLPINSNSLNKLSQRAYSLTKGHTLWLSLLVAQAKSGEAALTKLLDNIEKSSPDADDVSAILSDSILSDIWNTLTENHKKILRTLAESVRSETTDDFAKILHSDLTYNKFTRSLKALTNLNLIVFKRDNKYIELHPLVKEFIRSKYPSSERSKYITMFVNYFDKIVLVLKPRLSHKLSFDEFSNWTHQSELLVNDKKYQKALDTLLEVHNSMKSAGYIEEFLRAAKIFFTSINWSKNQISKYVNFESLFNSTTKSSIEYGDTELSNYLIEEISKTYEKKEPSYINTCSLKAYQMWFQGDFKSAIDILEEAEYLLANSKQDDKHGIKHHLGLAYRDTKDPVKINKALSIFLLSEQVSELSHPAQFNKDLSGQLYGNVGRCLQHLNEIEQAVICLCKSFHLIDSCHDADRILNLGYASLWINEVLYENKQYEAAAYFLRFTLCNWDKTSPGMANKLKNENSALDLNSTTKYILSLDEWRIEKYCKNFVESSLTISNGTVSV